MRLIDADALKQEFPKDTDWEYPVNTNEYVCEIIDSQPTIEPERKWIPVTEQLPKVSENILICDIDGDIDLGHLTRYGVYYPEFWGDRIKNVTAWMPLPEPWEGEDYETN